MKSAIETDEPTDNTFTSFNPNAIETARQLDLEENEVIAQN